MQGGIGFIVLGGLFIATLLKAIWNAINKDWDNQKFNAMSILGIFKWCLLSLILLIVFVIYILPHLDQ